MEKFPGRLIVREVVRSHGGEISVRSSAGEGTVFHLRLPRHPPAAQVAPEAPAPTIH